MMNDLGPCLRNFIAENFLFGTDTSYADDDSLLENGIVDSTGVLELITFLERAFQFRITDDELVPENLDSIDSLKRFIGEKLACEPSLVESSC